MADPRISVIIPAFNAMATLDRALRSIESQTFQPDEVIVVDDGSTDGTAEHVARHYPAIRLVRQSNSGCGIARNTGVARATGDWLAFLDADDEWLPTKLARQVPETMPADVGVVACRSVGQKAPPFRPSPDFNDFWRKNQVVMSSSLVRHTAFDEAGGLWTRRASEEYHLWLRLTGLGWRVVNLPDELVVYAPSAMSLSRQIDSFADAEFDCLSDIADRFKIPRRRLWARLAECCLRHSQGALYHRQMATARRLALRSLRYAFSVPQMTALVVSCAPVALLDARRRILGAFAPSGQ